MKPKKKTKPEKNAPPLAERPDWKKRVEEINKEWAKENAKSAGLGFGPLEGQHRFLAHVGGNPPSHSGETEEQKLARAEKVMMEKLARDPEVIEAKKNPNFVAFCERFGMPPEQIVWVMRLFR